jgi:hypothetical protein
VNQASETILSTFQSSCDEYAKLFLTEPRQDEIIKSLVNYYSKYHGMDVLIECIHEYVRVTQDPILVYNFALDSTKIRERVIEARKSKEDFNRLVKETEQRMREFDEL